MLQLDIVGAVKGAALRGEVENMPPEGSNRLPPPPPPHIQPPVDNKPDIFSSKTVQPTLKYSA